MLTIKRLLLRVMVTATLCGVIPLSPWPVSAQDVQPYAQGELLVQFAPSLVSAQAEAVAVQLGAVKVEPLRRSQVQGLADSPIDGWYHIILVPGVATEQALQRFTNNPAVERAELNYEVSINVTPNDPLFSDLWGLHNTGQSSGTPDADIDAPEAWEIQTGDRSVLVAIIDTGVDCTHPDLAANCWVNPGEIANNGVDDDGNGFVDDVHGYDFVHDDGDPFDDNSHGTHVSGTIGAVGNNHTGIVGVSQQVSIMAVKFLSSTGSGFTSDAIKAIDYATAMGALIMNNSWGGGGFSFALRDAIQDANDAGALFVAAAGNSARDTDRFPQYPSSYDVPNVVSVAATDRRDNLAGFSNYGPTSVDLGAPGVSILSTVPGGYAYFNGTSMATPHVVGAAVLIWAQLPSLDVSGVKTLLLNSVDPVEALSGRVLSGGRLNVNMALPTTPEHLVLQDQTIEPGQVEIFTATQSIIAGPAFAIKEGANVVLRAPLIRLVPDVHIEPGSIFHAVP